MLRRLILACTLLAMALVSASAQVPTKARVRPQDIVPAGDWKAVSNGRVDIRTGAPRALYFMDYGPLAGTPEEMARMYLKNNSTFLQLKSDISDLKLVRVAESPMGYHVEFGEYYQNVPVYGANTNVTIERSTKKIVFYASDYKQTVSVPRTTPSITPEGAYNIAVSSLHASEIDKNDIATQLMIYAEKASPRLSYRVTFFAENPNGDWEVFVDATTGEILSVLDRAKYYAPAEEGASKKVDGSGYAWAPEPLTQAQVWYGTPGYTDPGGACVTDPTTPQLDAQRNVVSLLGITLVGGVYKLEGPHVRVIDWESPTVPPVTAANPDSFRFNREQSGFEDVMVYYHIDNTQRYIQSLGFTNIQNLPIGVDPHGFSCEDNSHYVPSSNQLAFGEGGVDDAEEADVLWHEYGHAIQEGSHPGWGGGEGGALGEGFGDYWARSYGRSLSSFGWQIVFKWDAGITASGSGTFWDGRRCDDPRPYPPGGVGGLEIHDAGQLWATVLMEIWGDIGRTALDKCVLQSHFLVGSSPTMRDNAAAVIQADRSLYGGAHVAAMVNRFGARNFVDPTQYIPQIVHTPLTDTENLIGPYTVVTRILPGAAGLNPDRLKVYWGRTGAFTDSLLLTPTGTQSEFSAPIPGNGLTADYRYYIYAQDSSGAFTTSPANAPTVFYGFHAGLDVTPPVLIHTPLRDQALIRWPAHVRATVTDNLGVDSVWVDYVRLRGALAGSFVLTLTTPNTYEGNFNLSSSDLVLGDSIFYKVIARDRSTSHNITVSPAVGFHKFAIISARGVVLVVDDDAATNDLASSGKAVENRPASAYGLSSRLIARTLTQVGFVVDTVGFANHDTSTYPNYDIVLWSAGSKTGTMFSDVNKRGALVRRSLAGGKVWVEGGEVGYAYRKSGTSTDADPMFRRLVLHDSTWLSDVSSSNMVVTVPTHPIFTTPNVVSGPVPFPSSGVGHRDAMQLIPGDVSARKLAGWSTYPGQGPDTAGIIVYNPLPDPSVGQIVFDLFSFGAITDTVMSRKLIENTAEFLMTRPAGAYISAEPNSLAFGQVQLGDSIILPLRVKNLGTGSLDVTNITHASPRLTISPTSFSLAAQETIRVSVKFKPTVVGNILDTLRFISNATAPPVVPVFGRGGIPLVSVIPDSFSFILPSTNDTTRSQLRVRNLGTDTLSYTLEELLVGKMPSVDRSMEQQPVNRLAKNVSDAPASSQNLLGRGGPDAFGYIWIDSDEPGGPQFSWTDIRSAGTQITSWTGTADDGQAIVPLPFAFSFYGTPYNSIKVVTNGFLSVDVASTNHEYSNSAIPSTAEPNNGIYPWWDDLDLSSGGTVHYYSDVANNRFVVQYTNVPHYSSTGPGLYTFQVILSPSGDVVYQYLDMQQTVNSATIGIENAAGTIALQTVYNATYVHNNLAVRFTRDAVQWMSTNRTTGAIAPHDSQNVELRIHPGPLAAGDYRARLKFTGNFPGSLLVPVTLHATGSEGVDDVAGMPTEFALMQNYPNPFNPSTVIKYALPKQSHVRVSVYNMLGQVVSTLVDEIQGLGYHHVEFSGTNLATGVYFYRFEADNFVATKKLLLLK